MKRKRMTQEEHDKLLDIRKRGKRRESLVSQDERNFCIEMYERDPKGYEEVEAEMQEWLKGLSWWEL